MVRFIGDFGYPPDITTKLYQRALSVFEETGDRRGIAETLYRMGSVSSLNGDYREAGKFFRQSLRMSRKIDRYEIIAHCLAEMGYVDWAVGEYRTAEQRCRESLAYYQEIGYTSQIAYSLRNLARVYMAQGDYPLAKRNLQKSFGIYGQSGLRGMKAITLSELAHLAAERGALTEAQRLAETGRDICEELEYPLGLIAAHNALGDIASKRGNVRIAGDCYHEALQTALTVWRPSDALHALAGMALLLKATGEQNRAVELAFFIRHQPATWHWTREDMASFISDEKSTMRPEVLEAAREWGENIQIAEVVEGLFQGSIRQI